MGGASGHKIIAKNRKAFFSYEILDRFEAGIALLGPEVKSLRAGRLSLGDAYAQIRKGEVYLHNAHISPYEQAGRENPDPRRPRKLLLHRREIAKLVGKTSEQGFTLVPLSMYFKNGRAKVELGLARGKKQYDKRETIKKREQDREMSRLRRRGR